jgi:hypothetical protein
VPQAEDTVDRGCREYGPVIGMNTTTERLVIGRQWEAGAAKWQRERIFRGKALTEKPFSFPAEPAH